MIADNKNFSVNNLSKTYVNIKQKTTILKNINFKIDKGSVYALIGQNGSGKTTAIKCILNFLVNYSGDILCDNNPIQYYQERALVGYSPENLNFVENISLNEFIENIYSLKNIQKNREKRNEINHLLSLFDLKDLLHKPIKKFSKGTKRKLSFIQAIIGDPYILILDEPTDGLDPISRRNILLYIDKFAASGKYVLITSHLLSDLNRVCDKVGLLSKGRIIAEYNINKNLNAVPYITLHKTDGNQDKVFLNNDFFIDCKDTAAIDYKRTYTDEINLEQWYYDELKKEYDNNGGTLKK